MTSYVVYMTSWGKYCSTTINHDKPFNTLSNFAEMITYLMENQTNGEPVMILNLITFEEGENADKDNGRNTDNA